MITIIKKLNIVFYKIHENTMYVFMFVVYLILKIKVAVEHVTKVAKSNVSKVFKNIKNKFLDLVKYLEFILINNFLKNSKNNFVYLQIKSKEKENYYKSLAPPKNI